MNKINNILVVRSDRFGEFLLNIPALRALKEAYPHARLTLAVNSSVKDLAERVEFADEVVVWDAAFLKTIKRRVFDLGVALNPTKEAHWHFFAGGIKARLGYDRKWGFLLTHKMKDTKASGDRHEVECNLELVNLIGAKTADKSLSIKIAGDYPGLPENNAIAIHPFTSDPVKQWPFERFMELAEKLANEGNKVVLVGKEDEKVKGLDRVECNENIMDLINKTSLVELGRILKGCKLLISCDSGPVHLACAVKTPALALFRNDLPGKTARRWGPWGNNNAVIEKKDLKDITVNEVLNKTKENFYR